MGNRSSKPGFPGMPILMGNQSSSRRSEKFEQFASLPDDLASEILNHSHLSMKDKVALARTSKRYYGLFRDHIHAAKCLMLVAHGEQEAANNMLRDNPRFLLERCDVTDYSGRTFENITPYEYAYWAKDTHMCRMLESHMNNATKAKMLQRIDAIERNGLTYWQHGNEVRNSKHFDFTPLKTALRLYVDGYNGWSAAAAENDEPLKAAWLNIGIAQRELPVHVVNEYCHPDRSFDPKPEFNEGNLPRSFNFYNWSTCKHELLFPLDISDSFLGSTFALGRGGAERSMGSVLGDAGGADAGQPRRMALFDLEAVSHLDQIRTNDLTRSRENLLPAVLESGHSMRAY